MEGGERHAVDLLVGLAGGGPGGVEDGELAGTVVSLPSVAGLPGAAGGTPFTAAAMMVPARGRKPITLPRMSAGIRCTG